MEKAILPLLDLVLLTLGSVLAMMTQMERVTAMPVSITQVGTGAAIVQQGQFDMLTLSHEGMTVNGNVITLEELASSQLAQRVVLRADRDLPVGRAWQVMAKLRQAGCDVVVETRDLQDTRETE